jgi:phosphomannomutase
MAGLYVHEIFTNQAKYIFDDLDGNFPNHEANPLEEKNLKDLKKIVLEQKNDFGMIFDGDADRVMFVDEKSNFISPDLMIGLLGHYFLEERNQKGKVIQDIRTSKSVAEYLAPMGGEIVMWRVGRAYAATKLREIDGIYGGELAGHYYFRDFYYSDSGLLASILITNIISDFIKKGYKVSEIIAKIKKYENSGEINFKINHKLEAMNAVKDYFVKEQQPIAFYDFDGYRLDYNDWWFNIRPSNTEPYLRLIVEAKNNELLEEKLKIINNIISNYEKDKK